MTPEQKLDQMFRLTRQITIADENTYDVVTKMQKIYWEEDNNVEGLSS